MKTSLLKPFAAVLFALHGIAGVSAQEYSVRGHVTDDRGLPLAGAGVTIVNSFTGTYCGKEGEYRITLKWPGVYHLKFSFTGYEEVTRMLDVTGDMTLDVSLNQKTIMTDEVVVSATRAGTRTPVAYSTVNAGEIRQKNMVQDLPYILGMTPSLVETSETGTGIGYTSLRIRGTDGSRINITMDGIPLNDAESQQVFWVDLPDLSASVDNIQVQRGVGTSSNGAGAFGASVNIKLKNPGDDPFFEISSSAGSFNTFRNMVTAGTGLIKDKYSMQMRYSGIGSDGYIRRTGLDNRSLMLTGLIRSERSILKANIFLGEEHTGISWWGVPAELLVTDRRFNPAGEYEDELGNKQYYDNESDNYKQGHYQLIYSTNLSKTLFMHAALHYTKGKGYYEEYKEDQELSEYGLPDLEINTTTITESDLIRRKWMANDFYGMVWSLGLKKERIDAVFGGGFNVYDGDHFGRIIWMSWPGNVPKDYQWYLNNGRKSEASIYGKMNFSITERLTGFGDLQFRHIAYTMSGRDDDLRDLSQSHFFNFFNPKTGIFFNISQNQNAYLSFSVAGREPTRSDFKEATGDNTATPQAETLYDLESGYNLQSHYADLGINLYGMIYRDQLVPTGELSNVGYPVMTNVEKSFRTGVEVTTTLKPVNRLALKLNLTISRNKIRDFTSYYTDYNTTDWSSEYKSIRLGMVDIAYSPAVTGSGELTWDISGSLRAGIVTKYVGKQYFDNTMNGNRKIDPYIVNNFMMNFNRNLKSSGNLNLKFMVNNILNSVYESNAYGGIWYEDGAEKTWSYYFPQAGINFLVSLGLSF